MTSFIISENQVAHLKFILNKRKRLFITLLFAAPLTLYLLLGAGNPILNITHSAIHLLFFMAMASLLIFLYVKRIIPLKKDISNRQGILVPTFILSKDHFPLINKYFFFLDHPKFPNKEVMTQEYVSHNVGDSYYLPLSKNSGIILDGFSNWDLM